MANVFLSYDRNDVRRARSVAAALETAGHTVWWDRKIKGGAQYSREIDAALRSADAVVVLWSKQSIESIWVRDEAAAGRDRGVLVPVTLDQTEPPIGFRQFHTIDLSRRSFGGRAASLKELQSAVQTLDYSPTAVEAPQIPRSRSAKLKRRGRLAGVAAAAAAAAAGAYHWIGERQTAAPTIVIASGDASSSSKALARDLLVKLGSLKDADPRTLRLVDEAIERGSGHLIIEVATNAQRPAAANVVLRNGSDRAIIWSAALDQPDGRLADLQQQLAFATARMLDCLRDAHPRDSRGLSRDLLRLYLNGCWQEAETLDLHSPELVRRFRDLTERAPWFEPAWTKLLLWESRTVGRAVEGGRSNLQEMITEDIRAARKVRPDLPAAWIAEARLLPPTAFLERERLLNRALEAQPDSAELLSARSSFLTVVGRLYAAAEDARRASELEPLSPSLRHALISVLAYAGQKDAAFSELAKAETLWPGTSAMADARFRLHLRYGDPQEVLRLYKAGNTGLPALAEPLLIAKASPTPENIERARRTARRVLDVHPGAAIQAYAELGIANELYGTMDRWAVPVPDISLTVFRPAFQAFRYDRRFMQAMLRTGHLRYWHRSGHWPDFCSDPDLPYDCDDEAKKILS